MKKVLIIGGGFAGCTAAHQFKLDKRQWDITLVELSNELGAGVRTKWCGGHPYTFGPRHFLTPSDKAFDFLNKYVPLRDCKGHEAWTYIEGEQEFYNFPVHEDDLPKMPDYEKIKFELSQRPPASEGETFIEFWKRSIGPTLYEKFVEKYTKKHWGFDSIDLIDTYSWSLKGAPLKTGPRAFWTEWYSGYPIADDGYNSYFDLATIDINLLMGTKIEVFDIPNKRVFFKSDWHQFDLIINTISPDLLFDSCYGVLPYQGIEFLPIILPIEECFPKDLFFLYYGGSEKVKRIVEYKKFTQHKSPSTLIGLEIPAKTGRHYPYPIKSVRAIAEKYINLMPEGVFSIGRQGSYKYEVDIDDCILQVMDILECIK